MGGGGYGVEERINQQMAFNLDVAVGLYVRKCP
jgi:hypothetical protein